ncbi:beta-ketoacyl synthase N-terminal-like domain-containing protein [Nocardia altamirensis]|uniref:beta-ketoacyl synthase N-terminal-like domain-containing protein n=1 Tax=Nocardia altamirensis TaxID=472158 RepID=UPI0008403A80|nr:beta-ketoacyl synthase N-terminal-like domain-containing protein [Nocardia altamirensis]
MSWDIAAMSAVACVGTNPPEIYRALCAGRTGVAPLRAFDTTKYRVRHAYEIDDRAEPGRDEPFRATRWLVRVVDEALREAGLSAQAAEIPVLVGTTLRELRSSELWWRDGTSLALADLHFARALHERLGVRRTETVASACAAALYALGMATDLIESGTTDTVVVAATDAITESSFGGLDRVQSPAPQEIRPFDVDRRGMVMGEGAVALVLRARGVHAGPVHGVLRGVEMNCDAAHPTVPEPASVARAIRNAHDRSGIRAADVDFVIVHGSGTTHNDLAESQALRDVFAETSPGPWITSIKGGAGHTCGGSGLLSLVTAVQALRHGAVPPMHGLNRPMPEADGLRLVAGSPANGPLRIAQINAIGLGGINAVAVVAA